MPATSQELRHLGFGLPPRDEPRHEPGNGPGREHEEDQAAEGRALSCQVLVSAYRAKAKRCLPGLTLSSREIHGFTMTGERSSAR